MTDEPKNVLFSFCRAWERRDLAGALELVHRDVKYAMSIPQDVLLFGGETQGNAAMSDRMQMMRDQFDLQRFETVHDKSVDDVGHARVAYSFRHKATGETIAGTMRLAARVEDGLIVAFEQYHDEDRVRAFMGFVAYVATERLPIDR
ncbi:MAG: ketosteroid isomerase-like protein [Hyphomicrobiaceae bacterium]